MSPTDQQSPGDTPSSVTEAQVAWFEERIGSRLPPDYRSYLLNVNRGAPEPSIYEGEVMRVYVQYIFPLVEDPDKGLFREWRAAYLPETFKRVLIPVAKVKGGDLLYLSLVNGEVFFYSHEEDSFTRIENSFAEILSGMKNDDVQGD